MRYSDEDRFCGVKMRAWELCNIPNSQYQFGKSSILTDQPGGMYLPLWLRNCPVNQDEHRMHYYSWSPVPYILRSRQLVKPLDLMSIFESSQWRSRLERPVRPETHSDWVLKRPIKKMGRHLYDLPTPIIFPGRVPFIECWNSAFPFFVPNWTELRMRRKMKKVMRRKHELCPKMDNLETAVGRLETRNEAHAYQTWLRGQFPPGPQYYYDPAGGPPHYYDPTGGPSHFYSSAGGSQPYYCAARGSQYYYDPAEGSQPQYDPSRGPQFPYDPTDF
nr:hypothetical protein Iba_chr11fCG13450 [Ipomoea batatas]